MRWVIFVLAAILAGGCRRQDPAVEAQVAPIPFSGAEAFAECEAFVKLGPKPAGSEGSRLAAEYLRNRLQEIGVESTVTEFEDAAPGGKAVFRNVTGRLPGNPGRIVILAAHYDTKTGISESFVGANDSGSGVGLLLGLAKALKNGRPAGFPEVRFVFFDGEECRRAYGPSDGLHGSRRMARDLRASGEWRRVRAVILLDMVGDRHLNVTIPRNGTPDLIRRVLEAARMEGVRGEFGLNSGQILDDHQPFLDAGMPAVDLIDFEYGPVRGSHEYWHTDADTLDKLDPLSLEKVGRVVLRVLRGLGNG